MNVEKITINLRARAYLERKLGHLRRKLPGKSKALYADELLEAISAFYACEILSAVEMMHYCDLLVGAM